MAAILSRRQCVKIPLKFVSEDAVDGIPALVQVMTCHQTGTKPIPETMITYFTYSYTGLILGLRPANERRRYNVTPSLIGWAQT